MKTQNTNKKVSFTNFVDEQICNVKQTTNLSLIAEKLNLLAKKYNNNIRYTTSVLKAHIRYRIVTQNNKLYLSKHNLKLKDDNVTLIKKTIVTINNVKQ